MKTKDVFTFVLVIICISLNARGIITANEENDSSGNFKYLFNADIVNRYIWRGQPQCLNPSIQPYAWVEYKDFSLGAWSSYGIAAPYAEIDLYVSYSIGPLAFTINDYYNEDETDMTLHDYFQYSDKDSITTSHSIEGAITFEGTENFPFSATVATFFYGDDKDSSGNNYYSTYLELDYNFQIGTNNLSLFAGGTIAEGYYADKAALVNVGLKADKELQITEKYSLPIFMSLIVNPYAKDIFFTIGMTF